MPDLLTFPRDATDCLPPHPSNGPRHYYVFVLSMHLCVCNCVDALSGRLAVDFSFFLFFLCIVAFGKVKLLNNAILRVLFTVL